MIGASSAFALRPFSQAQSTFPVSGTGSGLTEPFGGVFVVRVSQPRVGAGPFWPS